MKKKIRCPWGEHKAMQKYHDTEWGMPVYNDKKLFEFLILEGAQAGLSWATILKRRSGYKKAYCNFNVKKVAKFNSQDIKKLINNKNIIRNKLKINASISNAKCFIEIQKEYGSFDKYIWKFVNNEVICNKFTKQSQLPATSKFTGSTIMYAHMQATGMVNDHLVSCFRYSEV